MIMMMTTKIYTILYEYSDCKLEAIVQDNTHVTVLF